MNTQAVRRVAASSSHTAPDWAARVVAFEHLELAPLDLDHRGRLALGAWYLLNCSETEATRRFLGTLSRYQLNSTNLPGELRYHETRTLFWLALTRAILQAVGSDDQPAAIDAVLARCGDKAELIHQYYTPGLYTSWRATHGWVAPDRHPGLGAVV